MTFRNNPCRARRVSCTKEKKKNTKKRKEDFRNTSAGKDAGLVATVSSRPTHVQEEAAESKNVRAEIRTPAAAHAFSRHTDVVRDCSLATVSTLRSEAFSPNNTYFAAGHVAVCTRVRNGAASPPPHHTHTHAGTRNRSRGPRRLWR